MNKRFHKIAIVFLLVWIISCTNGLFLYSHVNDKCPVEKVITETSAVGRDNEKCAQTMDLSSDDEYKFDELERLSEIGPELRDKPSPSSRIKEEQILVYDDQVIIRVKDPEWAVFTNTKSMDPVIDSTSKAIEVIPKSEEDIHLGDIVAYRSNYNDGIIAHRVVDISNDAFGWYARLKGDNNEYTDPGKVRFEQIKRVIIAVIY